MRATLVLDRRRLWEAQYEQSRSREPSGGGVAGRRPETAAVRPSLDGWTLSALGKKALTADGL